MHMPLKRRNMKVVIVSASRTGTLGLYSAMQMLGYSPYHMKEVLLHGSGHMKVLIEAIRAEHNRFSGIQRYRKEDYAKWFANYDCLIEVPFFMGSEAIEAYVDDPDVKFILTERDPDRWVSSINNTVAGVVQMASAFPIRLLKHFNDDLYYFFLLNELIYASISDCTLPGDAENRPNMRRNYMS
ncbi:hypothetical protein PLICBS_001813 [Purpureocillium lilacinum]|uniref:uncharacterized protein n=1 Tax=Purpureocillium lilacinum TaxID=33203 RepID=UPI002080BFFA|nr:hypothetical protein PLICBS_001813 [Purpureocillium lilacinum]